MVLLCGWFLLELVCEGKLSSYLLVSVVMEVFDHLDLVLCQCYQQIPEPLPRGLLISGEGS